jgi:hypothetical protein
MFRINTRFFLAAALFLAWPFWAQAAVCDKDTALSFVARDPNGGFIANAKVDVYKQELDANGDLKPTSRVAGGSIDSVVGRASLKWRNSDASSAAYAIRVQTISKDNASFWFYGFSFSCGESATAERSLSGLAFTLRDYNGTLLTNTNFSVYSQARDNNGNYLNAKDELLASLNSGATGQGRVYLPQGSVRSLDGTKSDYYVLEVSSNNAKSYLYNLYVRDGEMSSISYYVSALRVRLNDADGNAAVGARVEVYKQETGVDNSYQKGSKVGDFTIEDTGYGLLRLSGGTYVLAVKGSDNNYQYFWYTTILDGQLSDITLNLDKSFSSNNSCQKTSKLNLVLRNIAGDLVPGLKFEIYEQNLDANGLPTAGAKVIGGTLDSGGRSTVSFKADPEKSYAIKVWDKRADLGDYWFFDGIKFTCGYDRNISKSLPALKVILRDGQGNLKRNYAFSLFAQQYDADNNPVIADNGLIANLTTNSGGQAMVYVAPYNPYRRGQSGVYVVSAKDASGNAVNFYNINISADKDYTFQAGLSGLNGLLVDGRGRAQASKDIRLYAITTDSFGRHLGSQLAKSKTDANGRFSFEYPAGTYAIGVNDDFSRENVFWNMTVKAGGASQKLTLNLTNFSLSDSLGEGLPSEPSLKLYSLAGNSSQGYFRDKEVGSIKLGSGKTALKTLAAGSYLAVYTGKGNREYGAAFTAVNGSFQNVSITLGSKSAIKAGQSFAVSGNSASGVSGTSSNSSSSAVAPVSLSTSLKGRILIQTEGKGEAWYVNPSDGKKYYLGRPADAFNLMRRFGLGISNKDFAALSKSPKSWRQLAGKILIKTEDSGRAYYFDPVTLKLNYLGRPTDAFNMIRKLGLGISNANLNKISTGK